jgi:hypothetical protein
VALHEWRWAVGTLRNRNHISTQVSCVNDRTERCFWVTIALAIPMVTQQLPR